MTPTLNMKKLPVLLSGVGLSTLTLTAVASDWTIAPAITLEQTYTDNALLTNDNKQNESITVVRPSLSIYREGARARVDINYAPEYRYYWEDTEDDELVNFLRADASAELVQDHLFLDGWGTADLTNITSRGRTGLGGLTGRPDSTEVYTAGISPYFKSRVGGDFSLFEARYTLDSVSFSEPGVDDSVGQRADLIFGSGTAFANQIWELSAWQSRVDYDSLDDDNEVSQFRAEFAQQLSNQWALAFVAGYEDFNLAVNEDIDGSLWSVGVIYTPNQRTRLAIGGGERAFGDDYYLDFSHLSRRTVWTASYQRDYTSVREELMRPTLFERQDVFGNLVRDPVLENPPAVDREGTPAISPEYYELERFATSFTFTTDRTSLTLSGSRAERNYESAVDDTRDLNLVARVARDLSAHTNAYLRLSWTDHEEEVLNYEQWVVSLGGSYQLGAYTSLGLRLAHLERDAETEVDSYDENSATLSFTATF